MCFYTGCQFKPTEGKIFILSDQLHERTRPNALSFFLQAFTIIPKTHRRKRCGRFYSNTKIIWKFLQNSGFRSPTPLFKTQTKAAAQNVCRISDTHTHTVIRFDYRYYKFQRLNKIKRCEEVTTRTLKRQSDKVSFPFLFFLSLFPAIRFPAIKRTLHSPVRGFLL